MDVKNFIDIGIVEFFWNYDEFSLKWEKVFISIYIPKEVGYNYGEQYCLKISFLDNDDVKNQELFESNKFDLQILDDSNDVILIEMLGEKFKINENQLKKIKKL